MKTYLIIIVFSLIGGLAWAFGLGPQYLLLFILFAIPTAWWLYGDHLLKTGQVTFDRPYH